MITKIFTTHKNKMDIVFLGDTHIGNVNSHIPLLCNVIKQIWRRNTVWVGMGDYADAINVYDRRFNIKCVDKNCFTPHEQYQRFKQLTAPIQQQNIGYLEGNHDLHHWHTSQIRYVDTLGENLSNSCYLRIQFPAGKKFDIYLHHGVGAVTTKQGALNSIHKLNQVFPQADAYVMGHTHQLGTVDVTAKLYVDEYGEVREHLQYYVFSGSFLKAYENGTESYVETHLYQPNMLGAAMLSLSVNENGVDVSSTVLRGTEK